MRLRTAVFALIFWLTPFAALAQAVLQAGPQTAGHAPGYSTNGFGQPYVLDSGSPALQKPGGGLSELNITARQANGVNTPPFANSGNGQNFSHFCMYDADTSSVAGEHFLCFDANALGGGLISYGGLNGASTLPMQISVNGALYQFPFTVSGVTGPTSSAVRDTACWNNTAGSLLADCGPQTVFNVLDPRWGLNTGTGGDDSAAINAAIAAAATDPAGGGVVMFPPPPGGTYNVCANPITRPTAAYNSLTLVGTGSGSSDIRVLPGCASGIQEVLNDPPITFTSPATASSVRMALYNLRLDAYCIAPHVLYSGFDPGFNSHNVIYRNAKGGYDANGLPSSNVYIAGAYEGLIDASNRIENVNDTGHTCYAQPSDFPGYDLYTVADDWRFDVPALGAEIANYAAVAGGGNNFVASHGWGYSAGNPDNQAVSQPLYTYLSRGFQTYSNALADSPLISGGRSQVMPAITGVDRVTAIISAGSGGTPNSIVTLTGTTGTGGKFQGVGYTNNAGSLAGVVWVTVPGNYSVVPSNLNNEPVTSTGSLTGASVKIVMGSGGQNTDAPLVNGVVMEGALASGVNGWQVGIAETKFSMTNGQFEYLSSASLCIVSEGTLSVDSVVDNNINCSFSQRPAFLGLPNGIPVSAANAAGAYGQILNSNSGNDLFLGDISNNFAGVLHLRTSGADAMTISAGGAPSMLSVPTSAGGGGLYVCIDSTGKLYKKSSCP